MSRNSRFNSRRLSMVAIGVILIGPLQSRADDAQQTQRNSPKVRISRETTFVRGPVRKDGFIDYAGTINARLGRNVKPGNNAAAAIVQVLGPDRIHASMRKRFFAQLGIALPPAKGDYFVSINRYSELVAEGGAQAFSDQLVGELKTGMKTPWTKRKLPALASWLDVNDKHLTTAITASQRRAWFAPIVADPKDGGLFATLIPLTQAMRSLSQALTARAMRLLARGDVTNAQRDLLAAHRFARLMGRRFFIDCSLCYRLERTTFAADIALIQSGKLNETQLRTFQLALERLPPLPSLAEVFNLTERLVVLDAVGYAANHRYGGLNVISKMSDDRLSFDVRKEPTKYFDLVDWNIALQTVNAEFDRVRTELDLPVYTDRREALEESARRLKRLPLQAARAHAKLVKAVTAGTATRKAVSQNMGRLVLSLLANSPVRARTTEDVARTRHHLTVLALAIARFQKANGKLPPKLAALQPRYLKELPIDLFTDRPFVYKPTKTGYLLYSVGPNRKDDGGKTDGVGDADDIVVRMRPAK